MNLNDIIVDGTARFQVVRAATTKDIAQLQGDINVESVVGYGLKRGEQVNVGERRYSSDLPNYLRLKCVTAGTTGASSPDFSNIDLPAEPQQSFDPDLFDNSHWILQRGKSYALDDIAYTNALKSNRYLKCTQAGVSASTELNLSSVNEGDTITDGTVKWVVTKIGEVSASIIDDLVGLAPSTLDTLEELAAAINNDPSFYNSIASALAGKAGVDGTGATGTWGINISGNAATATVATTALSCSGSSNADTATIATTAYNIPTAPGNGNIWIS